MKARFPPLKPLAGADLVTNARWRREENENRRRSRRRRKLGGAVEGLNKQNEC